MGGDKDTTTIPCLLAWLTRTDKNVTMPFVLACLPSLLTCASSVFPPYLLVQRVVLEVEAAQAGEGRQGAEVVELCHLFAFVC